MTKNPMMVDMDPMGDMTEVTRTAAKITFITSKITFIGTDTI